MEYAAIIKQSFVDFPGKISAVLFTWGCNFRCPFCHNSHLLAKNRIDKNDSADIKTVLELLKERKGFLEAVVVSGGEPTLNQELPEDLQSIKEIGYLVKLDTNGSRTYMLQKLIEKNLVDYIAMDVKAPLDYKKYLQACGRLSAEEFLNIKSSIHILKNSSVKVEFRTTVVPVLHSPKDIVEIAKYLQGAELYSLQQFRPEHALDPFYRTAVSYSRAELQNIAEKCSSFVKEVKLINI